MHFAVRHGRVLAVVGSELADIRPDDDNNVAPVHKTATPHSASDVSRVDVVAQIDVGRVRPGLLP